MKKIEKLKINLFPDSLLEEYNQKRAKYISEYREYKSGGFLSYGYMKNYPAIGEAKWNNMYPEGFLSWKNKARELTSTGEQNIIDKVNEIIDYLNDLSKNTKKGGTE